MGDTENRTGSQGGSEATGEAIGAVVKRPPSSRAQERRAALTRYLAAERYHEVRAAPADTAPTAPEERP